MGKYDSLRRAVNGSSSSTEPDDSEKRKSKYDNLRMSMGLIPDTRPKAPEPSAAEKVGAGNLPSMDVRTSKLAEQASQYAPEPERPGRDLPIIGPVLKGLDAFSENPIVEKGASIARSLYTPGGGLRNVASMTGAVGRGLEKVAPSLGGATLGSRVAKGALTEGIVGAPLGAAQYLASGQNDLGEAAKQGAIGGLAGGAIGGAGPLVGRGLGKLGERYSGTNVGDILTRYFGETTSTPDPVLELPAGRVDQRLEAARQRSVLQPGQEPIANPYTPGLPNPSPRTVSAARNMQDATGELAALNDEIRNLESQYQKAINDQYKYLKSSITNRGGVTPGAILRDVNGDVIDRVGRISNNPKWYQDYFSATGRTPTNKELYNLAKQHVDEGFQDDAAFVPAWKQQNDYDDTMAALTQVRDQIRGSVKESGLGLTDAQLKTDVLSFQPKQKQPRPAIEESPILRSTPEPEPQVIDDVLTVKEPRIRDMVYNYLDEAEKAAKERIASRKGRLNSMPVDEYADYAIIGAAKIGKGSIKMADFTEEMVKEFGEQIRPQIKEVYRRSMAQVKEAERRASKEAQEAREFNAQDIGDADSFGSKISRDAKKERTPFAKVVEKIQTQFTDDLASLGGLEKKIRGKIASAEDSLYKTARLFRGMPAKAHQIVQDRLTPVVEMAEKAGFTSKELGEYALAVHARDVNKLDIKSGFTNKEIEAIIDKYGTAEMEKARQALVKIGDDMLAELADAGVISKDLLETLRKKYENYIPLFRNMDDEKVEFGRGLSDALVNVTAPIKKLSGSERQVIDPLENMVKNIFQSVSAAERNKVARQLSKLASEPGADKFIKKLKPSDEVGRKNVVSVLENGERVRYEVEPEVYKALMNLDQESSNMLIKVLQGPASLLRAGATLTPEFSLRNPLRDVPQAFIVSNSGFNPLIDFPVGIIQSIKKGELYKQWVQDMGDFGNIVSMDRKTHQEALEKIMGDSTSKKFVNIVTGKQLLGLLRAIADTSESATKVGEYRAALRQGQTRQEAAYRSRDIMDFSRSGSSVRQTNKVVAFLNANIQGKSKLVRAFQENKVGVLTRAFTAVTLPTIAAFVMQKYMANDKQKQIIDESPSWMTDASWLIPIPGTDQVARIPKPFDLAAIFSNGPERALKYVYNNDKDAFDKYVSKSLSDMAIPVQITGLMPFVEGMANYSFFRQGDIIPQREAGREFQDQYDIDTTETAKYLAKGANLITGGEGAFKNFSSPRVMDNTIKGLTAGLGTYATSAIDALLDAADLEYGQTLGPSGDNPEKPAKGVAQQPLAKAFLVNSLQGGKSMDKMYEMKDKLSKEETSAKLNKLKFEPEKKKLLGILEKRSEDMSSISKKIREIENSKTLSPEEKRRQIDALTMQRNQIARDTMKNVSK